jgi:hypothetical protein
MHVIIICSKQRPFHHGAEKSCYGDEEGQCKRTNIDDCIFDSSLHNTFCSSVPYMRPTFKYLKLISCFVEWGPLL